MCLSEQRRKRDAVRGERGKARWNSLELCPGHEALAKVPPECAVYLGVKVGGHGQSLVCNERGRGRTYPRIGEHLDRYGRVEDDQSSRPSSRRPSRTRSAPL